MHLSMEDRILHLKERINLKTSENFPFSPTGTRRQTRNRTRKQPNPKDELNAHVLTND